MSAQFQNSSPNGRFLPQHAVSHVAQSATDQEDHAAAFQPSSFILPKYVKYPSS